MPNYDEKTGIHYGVISQHSLNLDAIDSWYDNDRVYDSWIEEMEESVKNGEMTQEEMDSNLDNGYDNDYHEFYYEDSEYTAEYSDSLVCWFILKSPYYTFVKQCSPCAPGAGDLDNPVSIEEYEKTPHNTFVYGTVKAYCLPAEFFDSEYHKIPYKVYRVDNDQEVI